MYVRINRGTESTEQFEYKKIKIIEILNHIVGEDGFDLFDTPLEMFCNEEAEHRLNIWEEGEEVEIKDESLREEILGYIEEAFNGDECILNSGLLDDLTTDVIKYNKDRIFAPDINAGDKFTINVTTCGDTDLLDWYEVQSKVLVVDHIDIDSEGIYVKGCPYRIDWNEIEKVENQ